MNLEEMKQIWQTDSNQPSRNAIEQLQRDFGARLQRRHRFFEGYIRWVMTMLSLFTAILSYTIFIKRTSEFQTEWGTIFLLFTCWFFALSFFRKFQKHKSKHAVWDKSILETLRAFMDETELARTRLKAIGLLYLITIPLLGVAIFQLDQSGKVKPHELKSMVFLFGIVLTASAITATYYYYRRLLPRLSETKRLLTYYSNFEEK